jgi:formylglycine-generating enzyme required for sulfatase activity
VAEHVARLRRDGRRLAEVRGSLPGIRAALVSAVLLLGACRSAEPPAPETPPVPKPAARSPLVILESLDEWKAATDDERRAAAALVRERLHRSVPGLDAARFVRGGGPGGGFPVASFRDEATGIEFCLVPGGTYRLGTSADDPERRKFEAARQDVRLRPFLIAQTEVSQRTWQAQMGTNPSSRKDDGLPVDSVTWVDATEFCRRSGYLLPSEVQWEAAARGGTTTAYFTGNALAALNGFANVADQMLRPDARANGVWWHEEFAEEIVDGCVRSALVGSYSPNQFGLCDMTGNLSEWCRDSWSEAPLWTGTDPVTVDDPERYVVRGGHWGSELSWLRCASRAYAARGHASPWGGFRPVVEFTLPDESSLPAEMAPIEAAIAQHDRMRDALERLLRSRVQGEFSGNKYVRFNDPAVAAYVRSVLKEFPELGAYHVIDAPGEPPSPAK